MAKLVAISYDDETTADRAESDLERSPGVLIEPDAAVAIIRDGDGTYRVHTNHHVVGSPSSWGMLWAPLFAVLFFVPVLGMAVGAGVQPLIDKVRRIGIDDDFCTAMRELLQPGTSAVVAAVENDAVDGMIESLSHHGGTIVSASLSDQDTAVVQEHLHGSTMLG